MKQGIYGHSLRKLTKATRLLICIQEVSVSDLGCDNDYPQIEPFTRVVYHSHNKVSTYTVTIKVITVKVNNRRQNVLRLFLSTMLIHVNSFTV